ncbi:MAG: xylulokinase, partial [Anaerolineae bacterium]|nr:xylulokinase [Anaerolineae bacterium]
MSPKYIIAHDVGTSGNKAVLVDTEGNIQASAFQPYPVHYPRPDWAEQEPEDWWNAITVTTRQVVEQSGVAP